MLPSESSSRIARRRASHGVASAPSACTARALKIVVPLAAGGGADILARMLAEQIGRAQNVVRGGGEPPGRRHRDRHRGGGARRARRRDRAAHQPGVPDQSAHQEGRLRSADEFRSGLQHGELPAGVRRAGELAAEDHGRHDRHGEGQAGLGHGGERRHRQPDAYRLRGAEEGDRAGNDLRAVSRARRPRSTRCSAAISRGLFRLRHHLRRNSKAVRCGRSRSARDSASPACRTCRPFPSSATPTTKRKAGTACSRRRRCRRTRSRGSINWFARPATPPGEGKARRARTRAGRPCAAPNMAQA